MDSTEHAEAVAKVRAQLSKQFEGMLSDLVFVTKSEAWRHVVLASLENAYWNGRKDVYDSMLKDLQSRTKAIA